MVYLFWLSAAACARIRTVDVTSTTEQRATEWMTFESLPDFLDPTDPTKTTKGPTPLRSARWSLRQPFRRLTQYGHAGLAA